MDDRDDKSPKTVRTGDPSPTAVSDAGSSAAGDDSPRTLTSVASSSSFEMVSSTVYNTVVIGSGPIGLMAAASALRHLNSGEKIAIVADRIDDLGVRQQVLWVQQDVYDFMESLVGTEMMLRYQGELTITPDTPTDPSAEPDGYYITTGDFEQLFYDALKPFIDSGSIDLIKSEKIERDVHPGRRIQLDLERKTISL